MPGFLSRTTARIRCTVDSISLINSGTYAQCSIDQYHNYVAILLHFGSCENGRCKKGSRDLTCMYAIRDPASKLQQSDGTVFCRHTNIAYVFVSVVLL